MALVWAIMGVEVFAWWDKIALCGLMPRSPDQKGYIGLRCGPSANQI